MTEPIRARVSVLIEAPAADIYRAFMEPAWLTRFWLSDASGPLAEGGAVRWASMVKGAADEVTATHLEADRRIAWRVGRKHGGGHARDFWKRHRCDHRQRRFSRRA